MTDKPSLIQLIPSDDQNASAQEGEVRDNRTNHQEEILPLWPLEEGILLFDVVGSEHGSVEMMTG